MVFLAGQIGLHPQTMQLVSEDVKRQTTLTLKNISQVLKVVRSSQDKIFYITVFVVDLYASQSIVECELDKFFPKSTSTKYPCIIFLQMPQLPKNAKVEIQAFSLVESSSIPISYSFGNQLSLCILLLTNFT